MEHKRHEGVICEVVNDLPVVGVVTSIYVVDNVKVYMRVTCFETYLDEHHRVYVMHEEIGEKLIEIENLILYLPVHIRNICTQASSGQVQCFILPYYIQ